MVWGKCQASRGQVSQDQEVGPGASGLGRAGTHAVVGTHGVEGIGTAHKERGFVPKKQHLYKISTLALGWGGKTEAMVGVVTGVGVPSIEGWRGCGAGPGMWAWPGLGPHRGLKGDWIFQVTEEPTKAQK